MSVTSGFFNSLNGDRKYNAEQMSAIFDGIINNGVFANIGTCFGVTAATTGNGITVGVGRAWFNSAWIYNDAVLPLELDESEVVLNRYDAVVIEVNHTESVRKGDVKIIKGTPASSPSYPAMTKNDYVNQYPLAYIYRAAGATTVNQADITNRIGTSDCPYITAILQVTNIDNIVAQWQGEWDVWSAQWPQWQAAWNQWFMEQTGDADEQMVQWISQTQASFETWFESLQVTLEGDVAATLAAGIVELNERFETLAKEHAVYEPIQDSNGDDIHDNNDNQIEGRTVLGASDGGGSKEEVITPASIGAYSKTEANTLFAQKPKLYTITLVATEWESKVLSVDVPGVVGDETKQRIFVSPAEASRSAYNDAGVQCIAEDVNSLTFSADETPAGNLTVLVTIEEVAEQ